MAAQALVTPYAILSFPQLFTPKPRAEQGPPVFSCALLFSEEVQKGKEYRLMEKAVKSLAASKFPGVPMEKILLPFRDAGEKQYAGYEEGMTFINPWSTFKPQVVDGRLQEVLDPAEVWAGQTVCAYVTPFTWTNSGKHGISFGLSYVPIVKKDSPRIDGRVPAKNVFKAIDADEDDVDDLL